MKEITEFQSINASTRHLDTDRARFLSKISARIKTIGRQGRSCDRPDPDVSLLTRRFTDMPETLRHGSF
jgi:hypothetical protein